MKSNFTTGIIIGIIIGVVGVKILAPTDTHTTQTTPQVQTRTVVVPSYQYSYGRQDDGWDEHDYAFYGLHERGFH